MAFYRTCVNCKLQKKPCLRRDELAEVLRGQKVTSVKFHCDQRRPLFEIGQRVSVTWAVPDGWEDDSPSTLESWPATVIAERGSKWQILVDDTDSNKNTPARSYIKNKTLYAKVTSGKLTARDEAPLQVCGVCQNVVRDNQLTACHGYEDDPFSYEPCGCIKPTLALANPKGDAP
jgi:hypothetical protein